MKGGAPCAIPLAAHVSVATYIKLIAPHESEVILGSSASDAAELIRPEARAVRGSVGGVHGVEGDAARVGGVQGAALVRGNGVGIAGRLFVAGSQRIVFRISCASRQTVRG